MFLVQGRFEVFFLVRDIKMNLIKNEINELTIRKLIETGFIPFTT